MKLTHSKRIGFLALSFLLIAVGFVIFLKHPPIGDMLKALPDDNATRLLSTCNKFEASKKLFILVKGFDAKSLEKTNKIKNEISKIKGVERVFFSLADLDQNTIRYLSKNRLYLSDFNSTKLSIEDIEQKLNAIAGGMQAANTYAPFNSSDPLGLFSATTPLSTIHKDGFMIVPNNGYCIMASISPSINDTEGSRRLYESVGRVLSAYKDDTVVFSPNFYSVENSSYIKADIEKITILSIAILLIVYFFMLRNRVLALFSVTTLFLSGLFAIIAVRYIIGDVSILVLAFGAGIATIAEDYLFLIYLNNDYKYKRFNWQVFWGFMATEVGLLSLCFINFPLIAQLALFSFISLAISFCIFAFVFPSLQFHYQESKEEGSKFLGLYKKLRRVPPPLFMAISIAIIIFSLPRLSFDADFRNLDYQNTKLLQAERLFNEALGQNRIPVLIQAKTQEEALLNAEILRKRSPGSFSAANLALSQNASNKRLVEIKNYNFEQLKSNLDKAGIKAGFRSGAFGAAYLDASSIEPFYFDAEALKALGVEIILTGGVFVSLAYVPPFEIQNIKSLEFAAPIIGKELLSISAVSALKNFSWLFVATILLLLIIIAAIAKKRSLFSINFILFPAALIIGALALKSSYNLMHLFAIFLMMVYGVDYGIYLLKSETSSSLRAVIYSCITTFAGFGALIASSVPAVNAIGEAVCIGLIAVVILLFQKEE